MKEAVQGKAPKGMLEKKDERKKRTRRKPRKSPQNRIWVRRLRGRKIWKAEAHTIEAVKELTKENTNERFFPEQEDSGWAKAHMKEAKRELTKEDRNEGASRLKAPDKAAHAATSRHDHNDHHSQKWWQWSDRTQGYHRLHQIKSDCTSNQSTLGLGLSLGLTSWQLGLRDK